MVKHLISGVLTATILLSGCAGVSTPTDEDISITIGGIGPLTGDAASYGLEFQRSAELALEDVNKEWASKGMSLEIQWEDGGCTGMGAATASQKLISVDGVESFLVFCSPEVLAASPIAESEQIVVFSPGASSPAVTDAGDYVFRNWPSDAFQGKMLAEMAYDQGYRTLAVISEQQDYTLGISDVFKDTFTGLGGTFVQETYLPEDIDFKTQLVRLNAENPDAYLINPQTPIKGEIILNQMTGLGISGPFFLNDAAGTNLDLIADHADLLEGAYTATVQVDPEDPAVAGFASRYENAYGDTLNYLAYSASSYDSVWILAQAIEEVGNDGAAIQSYLSDFPGYDGLIGATDFDVNGDPMLGHSVFVIEGGELLVH